MVSALDVAQYVISYCHEKGYPISNLKLQKILYFIQAEFLVSTHTPCFYENIEAWEFGPVVPEVYQKYKIFGSSNIGVYGRIIQRTMGLNNREINMINNMVDDTSKYSATQLVDITHRQSPWVNAYKRHYNNIITNESIKEFFEKN